MQLSHFINIPLLFFFEQFCSFLCCLAAASPFLHDPYKGMPSFPKALPSGDYGRRPGALGLACRLGRCCCFAAVFTEHPHPHGPPAVFVKAGETFNIRPLISFALSTACLYTPTTLTFSVHFFPENHNRSFKSHRIIQKGRTRHGVSCTSVGKIYLYSLLRKYADIYRKNIHLYI